MRSLKVNCETSSEHTNGTGQVIITCTERNDNCNARSKHWRTFVEMSMFDISLALLVLAKVSRASIVGVTYMDDFDFEQRYRNLHECDPFYWHPLHLPDECAKMFGNLIRSKIRTPYKVVKEKEPYGVKQIYGSNVPYQDYSNSVELYESFRSIPQYAVPIEAELKLSRPLTPLDKMFEFMRRDVEENPSAPRVVSTPYFGAVALYRQPVSHKTKDMIKTLSRAYAKGSYQS